MRISEESGVPPQAMLALGQALENRHTYMVLAIPFCLYSELYLQEEYDTWDAIADYVFQVIPFSVLLPGNSTLLMEELRCCRRIDAP